MKSMILALQLLTRLPIPVRIDADMKLYARAQVFYPLCGLVVGLLSFLAWRLGVFVSDGSYLVAALLAALAMALTTGALHLDGLSDSADGLLSSREPERMLEIMKDSRMGVMGAMALVFDIVARLVFVSQMGEAAWLALLAAPIAAKSAVSAAAWSSPYARKEGLGQSITEYTKLSGVLANIGVALACVAVVFTAPIYVIHVRMAFAGILGSDWRFVPSTLGWACLASPLVAGLLGFALARLVTKRLGGVTGDIYGAVNEIVELLIFLSFVVMLGKLN